MTTQFENFISEHSSYNHPLFSAIEELAKAGCFPHDDYKIFAINIVTRTMMSLSEIHVCCIQASLDLSPKRIAYGVMTGAEEGGFGRPRNVHSILMMNAINIHGKVCYNMEAIDLHVCMSLVRSYYILSELCEASVLLTKISKFVSESQIDKLTRRSEYKPTLRRLMLQLEIQLDDSLLDNIEYLESLQEEIKDKISRLGILESTLNYCIEQFRLLDSKLDGYVQGVSFAHETLADGMLYKIFRIMYSQIDKYEDESFFFKYVYPYFKAHGNYYEQFTGKENHSKGVEKTHAIREIEKLKELDDVSMRFAFKGAVDFAKRNGEIWDELHNMVTNRKLVLS